MASGRPCGTRASPKHRPVALPHTDIRCGAALKNNTKHNMVDSGDCKMETRKDPLQRVSVLTGRWERVSTLRAASYLRVLISFPSSCGERLNSKIDVGGKISCLSRSLLPQTHPVPTGADFYHKTRIPVRLHQRVWAPARPRGSTATPTGAFACERSSFIENELNHSFRQFCNL